jgi:hypothetical protein
MEQLERRLPLDPELAKGENVEIAVSMFLPEDPNGIVFFAFPGGGYNRRYYHLAPGGRDGYSQAEHHVGQGIVVATCDPVGVGESTIPLHAWSHADVAAANAAVVDLVLADLTQRSAFAGVRDPLVAIGLGQSYGGLLMTLQQARHASFDGIGLLGWSGIHTKVPVDPGVDLAAVRRGIEGRGLDHPFRCAFHWPDVPEAIVEEDMRGLPEPGRRTDPDVGECHDARWSECPPRTHADRTRRGARGGSRDQRADLRCMRRDRCLRRPARGAIGVLELERHHRVRASRVGPHAQLF